MIHPSGTFEYQAEFTKGGFSNSDIVLLGTDRRGKDQECLVGLNPKIRFWNDRLVLVASDKSRSSVRNVSFPIGDAVRLTARAGDRLYLTRTGSGGIGFSLLRRQRLILAIGAVTELPLGPDVQVSRCSTGTNLWEIPVPETWLEFRAGSEELLLRGRQVSGIGDYHIYLEHLWQWGLPGTDECVSISVAGDSAVNLAAMRSAILLGNGNLKLTSWDCTEQFIGS